MVLSHFITIFGFSLESVDVLVAVIVVLISGEERILDTRADERFRQSETCICMFKGFPALLCA